MALLHPIMPYGETAQTEEAPTNPVASRPIVQTPVPGPSSGVAPFVSPISIPQAAPPPSSDTLVPLTRSPLYQRFHYSSHIEGVGLVHLNKVQKGYEELVALVCSVVESPKADIPLRLLALNVCAYSTTAYDLPLLQSSGFLRCLLSLEKALWQASQKAFAIPEKDKDVDAGAATGPSSLSVSMMPGAPSLGDEQYGGKS
jgi:hypothetical protein